FLVAVLLPTLASTSTDAFPMNTLFHPSTMTSMAAKTPQPTLRGRTTEMSQLDRGIRRALSGQVTRILIGGEAGIGKTRLMAEALDLAAGHGFQVATARADEMQQTRPFGVIAD